MKAGNKTRRAGGGGDGAAGKKRGRSPAAALAAASAAAPAPAFAAAPASRPSKKTPAPASSSAATTAAASAAPLVSDLDGEGGEEEGSEQDEVQARGGIAAAAVSVIAPRPLYAQLAGALGAYSLYSTAYERDLDQLSQLVSTGAAADRVLALRDTMAVNLKKAAAVFTAALASHRTLPPTDDLLEVDIEYLTLQPDLHLKAADDLMHRSVDDLRGALVAAPSVRGRRSASNGLRDAIWAVQTPAARAAARARGSAAAVSAAVK